MKHTPGPWMLTSTNPHDGWEGWEVQAQPVLDAKSSWTPPIAGQRYAPRAATQPFTPSYQGFADTLALCTGPQSNDMRQANARLIAAAPDLLAALEWYVAHDETGPNVDYNLDGYGRARAALAKARGES